MRELRVQNGIRPVRVFYAFEPRRTAILLIGGDKIGNDRFYEQLDPVADVLYYVYKSELKKEGLIPCPAIGLSAALPRALSPSAGCASQQRPRNCARK